MKNVASFHETRLHLQSKPKSTPAGAKPPERYEIDAGGKNGK